MADCVVCLARADRERNDSALGWGTATAGTDATDFVAIMSGFRVLM